MKKIILASASPRRKELLSRLTTDFEIVIPRVDEIFDKSLSLEEGLLDISLRKAQVIGNQHLEACVISADTIVVFGQEILGKPKDEKTAYAMLSMLSGEVHSVYTGVTILLDGEIHQFISKTNVKFYSLTEVEITEYIQSQEPMDKAGAYGIQGLGGLLVESIEGDYYNVVGFPIASIYRKLKELSVL